MSLKQDACRAVRKRRSCKQDVCQVEERKQVRSSNASISSKCKVAQKKQRKANITRTRTLSAISFMGGYMFSLDSSLPIIFSIILSIAS